MLCSSQYCCRLQRRLGKNIHKLHKLIQVKCELEARGRQSIRWTRIESMTCLTSTEFHDALALIVFPIDIA